MSRTGLRVRSRAFGRSPPSNGFTLIEVLVSLVILSVGIVAVLAAFGTSLFAIRASRDAAEACMAMDSKLSELELLAMRESKTGFMRADGGFQSDGIGGEVRITPVRATANGSSTLNRVSVRVWTSADSPEFSAETYVRVADGRSKGSE